jgi:GT2 family glycosyltransferase
MSGAARASIVIPTRNEAEDIAATLEACLAQDYPEAEVIVVDDSDDSTPAVVERFRDRGVRLIRREANANGCCGARNVGLREARGEFVVLLNADAVPAPDLLRRLQAHYDAGADYVVVRSRVKNRARVWGKLAEAQNEAWLAGHPPMEWSEGFSCRRSAAGAVGGIPGDYPVPFCRDWRLGEALGRAGFRKVVDLDIEVEHVVPDTLRTFWRQQVWRASMWAPGRHFLAGWGLLRILAWEGGKAALRLGRDALVWPVLAEAGRLGSVIMEGPRTRLRLAVALLVRDLALTAGAMRGVITLARGPAGSRVRR